MSVETDVAQPKSPRPATTDYRGKTPLFYLSISKLIIMHFATFGFFQIYWMYKQWIAIKYYEGLHIRPMWRVMFGIIWIFPLAWNITRICHVHGVKRPFVPLLVWAVAFAIFAIMSQAPEGIGALVALCSVCLQIPFQMTANAVVRSVAIDIRSPPFSAMDKAAIVITLLTLGLLLSGIFLNLADQ